MKKIIICLLFVMVASQFGCKKFLDIVPKDKLTGNNFYTSVTDIETNMTDMYGILFAKYTTTNTAGATGEFRSGEVVPSSNTSNAGGRSLRGSVALLGGYDRSVALSDITPGVQPIIGNRTSIPDDRLLLNAIGDQTYKFFNLTTWKEYYQVIQTANIMISKLQAGVPGVSPAQTKSYIEEAKFIRCYSYFTMVRLFGDVVYYTTAYQKDPLPRTDMVTVVKNCIADLKSGINDMPMTVTDVALKGTRASKGAVIGLLMNMNMWNAGFDIANKTAYWQDTEDLGKQLVESHAFRLLDLNEWATVVKGRSEESLFELFYSVNYNNSGGLFAQAQFGESFIHFPYRLPRLDYVSSPCVFTSAYMNKLYPDLNDGRLTAWFDVPFDQNAETFQMKKFAYNTNLSSTDPLNTAIPDATFLIMRYSDAILLRAEACADLGGAANTATAVDMLNLVRGRALATLYPGKFDEGVSLGDVIFYERAKELMGEGSHYFDLVRTKRIYNKIYTDNPLTPDKFLRGGWTWPLDQSVLNNNSYIGLNTYWVQ